MKIVAVPFRHKAIKMPCMKRWSAVFFPLVILLTMACKQRKEAESTREMIPDAVYFDYQVRGNEEDDSVTILANFREFDQYGYALKLDTPSTIRLDGDLLSGTTLKIPGTYYEVQKETVSFTGQHQLLFTDIEKKVYVEKFNFQPLTLTTPLPATLPVADLKIGLAGLDSGDIVHILLTDTAYASEGVERQDTVTNSSIMITAEELAGLSEGPVQLEIVRERVRSITKDGQVRGKLAVIYGIKREFLLSHPKKPQAE
jgi:hypothetical protein